MLTLDQFDYHLPDSAIAQEPMVPRDASKLLVLNRQTGKIDHTQFFNVLKYLKTGDVLVRNNTKVIPARLFAHKSTGGKVEILLDKQLSQTANSLTWEGLTKPGLKPGQEIFLERTDGSQIVVRCEDLGSHGYSRILQFQLPPQQFWTVLDQVGEVPLPPYITQEKTEKTQEQYQTTYAKHQGSVAAPTAGLHFTPELDEKLIQAGVEIVEITLHVGLGTFLPVKTENIADHTMHEELFSVSEEAVQKLNAAKAAGHRIIAVGTTTTRVLETLINQSESKSLISGSGSTGIYIYPPKKFKYVDGLITNFHLPKSTLLMLVSAFVSEPNTDFPFTSFKDSSVGKAYAEAIQNEYRFFSFGDAMLIL